MKFTLGWLHTWLDTEADADHRQIPEEGEQQADMRQH